MTESVARATVRHEPGTVRRLDLWSGRTRTGLLHE